MARVPRAKQIDETVPGAYHCISRCVRRAILCGCDTVTGKNYDYRRQWIQDRMEQLAGSFLIDILGFGLMGNHFHCILRNRPDLARQLSDVEVVLRWWQSSTNSRAADGTTTKPISRRLLQRLLKDRNKIREYRRRLSSISWFMSYLKQPIAMLANRQDGVSGRFWEGRFRSEKIESHQQLLAAMVYIDLNPIRAGMAQTPEESLFTGVYQRIEALRQRQEPGKRHTSEQPPDQKIHEQIDAWLSPLEFDERSEQTIEVSHGIGSAVELDLDTAARQAASWNAPRRASDRGCLPISLEKYLLLVDWTGRQLRTGKRGKIPRKLPSLFTRLGFSGAAGWLNTLQEYAQGVWKAYGAPANQATELAHCDIFDTDGAATIGRAFI